MFWQNKEKKWFFLLWHSLKFWKRYFKKNWGTPFCSNNENFDKVIATTLRQNGGNLFEKSNLKNQQLHSSKSLVFLFLGLPVMPNQKVFTWKSEHISEHACFINQINSLLKVRLSPSKNVYFIYLMKIP